MTEIYTFHVNLFATPQPMSFAVSWEEASAALETLPRMIFELDGSFIFSGSIQRAGSSSAPNGSDITKRHRWQVDGYLFDFDDRLHRVELHGDCPPGDFDRLLRCLGWPAQQLVFEMVRQGVTLDESEFRRRAGETIQKSL